MPANAATRPTRAHQSHDGPEDPDSPVASAACEVVASAEVASTDVAAKLDAVGVVADSADTFDPVDGAGVDEVDGSWVVRGAGVDDTPVDGAMVDPLVVRSVWTGPVSAGSVLLAVGPVGGCVLVDDVLVG